MLPHEPNPTGLSRPADPKLRASDRERERMLDILREASAEGRLTVEELEARSGQALGARSRGDLDRLVEDLPGAGAAAPAQRRPRTSSRRHSRPPRGQLVAFVAVNLLLIAIWAVTGAGYFWPIWPLLGWGIGLARHALTVGDCGRPTAILGRRSST